MDHVIGRRTLFQAATGGLALAALGAVPTATGVAPRSARLESEPWLEADVATLQRMMRRRQLDSAELVRGYLQRIAALNPLLHAVIETNPDALRIARRRDEERRHGRVRGPLHGIPVLIKDNIATDDRMETTAGSLALVGSRVPADAVLVAQLRRAGAVVLGKTNLSEWANFRGNGAINGWSARGGFTRNPYDLGLDPSGSSSGSGSAAAANLSAITVGTETDGSITSPASQQSLVGIKPTVGLVSGRGIIPIARSQDTAGPMCRSVTDAALLLDALRLPGRRVLGRRVPASYTECLDRRRLRGARFVYDRRFAEGPYGPGDDETLALLENALDRIRRAGAVVDEVTSVDPYAPDETGRNPGDDEFTVLLYEFKVQIAEYLSTLRKTSIRTLADLIAFNRARCAEELKWFGQEVFELAETTSGNLRDPEYLEAAAVTRNYGRRIIDGFRRQGYDAVLAPTFSFFTAVAATAGYPSMTVPAGYVRDHEPVGLGLATGFMEEPRLIGLGYAIEQLLDARVPPTFTGSVPPDPPLFNGCATPAPAQPGARRSAPAAMRRRREW